MVGPSIRLAGLLGLLCAVYSWSPSAQAAAPPGDSFYDQRGYVYLSPGMIAVPLGDDEFEDAADVSYQYGLGVGGMISPASTDNFGITIGFAFEHVPVSIDDDLENTCELFFASCDINAHLFRLLPELRLGGGFRRVFIYGLVAPGLALSHVDIEIGSADEDDTDVGFNLGLGAGAQFMVWRRLALGLELGADLGFFPDQDDGDQVDLGDDNDYGAHTLDVKLLLGWYF